MLEAAVWRDGVSIFEGLALNDVVVARGAEALAALARRLHAHGYAVVLVEVLLAPFTPFVVDELFGQQDIVIKALGPSLASVRGFAGAAGNVVINGARPSS